MENFLLRQEILLGESSTETLKNSTVAVVGLGGVGGAAVEALVRAGVSNIIIADYDTVDITNLNRQIMTTYNDIGKLKTDVTKKRLLAINPSLNITKLDIKVSAETIDEVFDLDPDFIVDAIDMVSSKLLLIETANNKNVPIISSMGTGNRLSPFGFKIGSISETAGSGCKLARVMRLELKKRNIFDTVTLYSTMPPVEKKVDTKTIGSVSFVPPVAGYMLASYVVGRICFLKQ